MSNNKEIAKKATLIWNSGKLETVNEVYAPNYVYHQQGTHASAIKGIEALKHFIQEFRHSFPDFKDTIEQQICEGNLVVTRFTSHGTHKGQWMGVQPTNKKVSWTGIIIDRIENGKIVESWVNWDLQSALEQLGVSPLHAHH